MLTVEQLKEFAVKPEVVQAVDTYLLARTTLEVMQEENDKVYAEVLQRIPIWMSATKWTERTKTGLKFPKQILTEKEIYLADDAEWEKIYREADKIFKERKYKPEDMDWNHDHLYQLKENLIEAEHLIASICAPAFDLTAEKLFEHWTQYKQFIDLIVKLVVNQPGYVNPLTKLNLKGEKNAN